MKLGKPFSWVVQIAKLHNLTDSWKERMARDTKRLKVYSMNQLVEKMESDSKDVKVPDFRKLLSLAIIFDR